jgi:hypothetical protein
MSHFPIVLVALLTASLAATGLHACARELRPGACLERPDLFVDKTRKVTRFVRADATGQDESCRLVCGHISIEGELSDDDLAAILELVAESAEHPVTHVSAGARDAVDAGVQAGGAQAATVTTGINCAPLQGEGMSHELNKEAGGWAIVESSSWTS